MFSLIKTIVFAAMVLLVGQVPVGRTTIGAHFQQWVLGLVSKGIEKADIWRAQAGIANIPLISRDMLPASRSRDAAAENIDMKAADDDEEVTPSDQESILRLLQ